MDRRFSSISRLVVAIILVAIVTPASGKVIYVDGDANGLNNGSSWSDAYNYLQDALADANTSAKPVEIHVAEGIYTPDSNSAVPNGSGDRTATFQLINGVTIKGGYAGFGEADPNAHDIEAYETILSGDLSGNDVEVDDPCDLPTEPTRAENSFHVVTGNDTDSNAVLDGFTITGGNANGSWQYHQDEGGGIHNYRGSPRIDNCTISANSASEDGGGIYNTMLSNSVLTNCIFNGNSAHWGGGMRNQDGSKPTLTNCEFIGNKAVGPYATGGGLYGVYGSITNCTFSDNSAQYAGGGLANCGGHITYCTITGNSAGSEGGGMHCDTLSPPTLTHCTVAGNTARRGGAMYFPSTPTVPPPCPGCPPTPPPKPITIAITSCTFIANSAGEDGGAIYHIDSGNYFIVNPVLTNCIFSENSAGNNGGAMYHDYYIGRVMLTNCTISRNLAGNNGGGTYRAGGSSTLTNSILWANSDGGGTDESAQIYYTWTMEVNYSCIQGWTGTLGGTGNNGDDPLFGDPNNGDYHLKSQAGRWEQNSQSWVQDDVTSPCIDAGDPMSPIGLEPFPNGGRVNMGAYGGTVEASKSYFGQPVCEVIMAGDVNGDCIVNFLDFRIMALHWLQDYNPTAPP
ncbi:MAG: hypothetical protein AMJ75_05755 [Phycisphaerae bacterium SM1_79]|nr:MAG: hypothetical protein AMJ75_05755 [Phycisphaerae bacterium SM1_79]